MNTYHFPITIKNLNSRALPAPIPRLNRRQLLAILLCQLGSLRCVPASRSLRRVTAPIYRLNRRQLLAIPLRQLGSLRRVASSCPPSQQRITTRW